MIPRNDLSAKSFYIKGLLPTSNYDVFIKDCNENYASTEVDFQTLPDGNYFFQIYNY